MTGITPPYLTLTFNMLKIAKQPRTRSMPKLTISSSSSSSFIDIAPHSRTRPPWFSHKSSPRTQAMCLFGQQNLCTFQSKTPRHKATNCQHSSKRRHCLVTRRLLSRGAVCANAHACAMYVRTVLAFLVRPGALGRLNEEKLMEQV